MRGERYFGVVGSLSLPLVVQRLVRFWIEHWYSRLSNLCFDAYG